MTYPAVVLLGGKGTRVASLTGPTLPKAMLPVCGVPFIDFKLRQLAVAGVDEVLLLAGHGAEPIRDHVGDGRAFGLTVRYVVDPPGLLGTGGAIAAAMAELPETFWLTYGDTYLPIDLDAVERSYVASGCPALMTVLRNHDHRGRGNVAMAEGRVVEYRKGAPAGTFELIEYGMLILPRSAFAGRRSGARFDLAEVLRDLAARSALAAHEVTELFWEIGTPEALADTERFLVEMGVAEQLGLPLPGWA